MTNEANWLYLLNAEAFAVQVSPINRTVREQMDWTIFVTAAGDDDDPGRYSTVGILTGASGDFEFSVGVSGMVRATEVFDPNDMSDALRQSVSDSIGLENLYDVAARTGRLALALANREFDIDIKAPTPDLKTIEDMEDMEDSPNFS